MEKPMTPSTQTITDGQIDKVTDLFRAALRKHRAEFGSEAVQQAVGLKELGTDLLEVVRKHVERFSKMIVRLVTVEDKRSAEDAVTATGRNQYVENAVMKSMPRGEGKGPKKVVFFNIGRFVSDDELDKEYILRGLKPIDPFTLAAVNEADPTFADKYPNGTHWKDTNGKWCCIAFCRWGGGRCVRVGRFDNVWGGFWWFAGEQVSTQS